MSGETLFILFLGGGGGGGDKITRYWAVHKLRHAKVGGGGLSASVTMYTLNMHASVWDEGEGSIMVKNSVT